MLCAAACMLLTFKQTPCYTCKDALLLHKGEPHNNSNMNT